MNNQEKVRIFQTSCEKALQKDVSQLNRQIEVEMEQQMKDEIHEYQEKEEWVYTKNLEKLEKEYNKQIYALEMDAKKEVLNQKKQIQKDLKKEVLQIVKEFTKTPEYKAFLMKRIEEVFQKVEDTEHTILRLLPTDLEKYGEEIQKTYHVKMQTMANDYIGGCMLEDETHGLFIDHTIQNSMDEKFGNELR